MVDLSKHEEGSVDVAELAGDLEAYRLVVIKTLVACVRITLALNDSARRHVFTKEAEERFRASLRSTPTTELEKRIYAVQAQNPGVLLNALKNEGFDVKIEGDSVHIDYVEKENPAGRFISKEEFEAI